MKIGVLAMQGAFEEHCKVLESLGVETVEVRKHEELKDLDGLVIPGGESTTIGKMMSRYGLLEPVKNKIEKGFPVFGTCAGLVLLSKNIDDGLEGQPLLGILNVLTIRNAYGRQVDSFESDVEVPGIGVGPFHGVFIRAPIVKSVNNNVKILAKLDNDIVAIRENNVLATAFHPELTNDSRFHAYFIDMIREYSKNLQ